jgi:acyl-coenzyme A thioesterase PaaI-like protein
MKGRPAPLIRARVLRGIALNRTPGLHFPGNLLDISFEHVARDRSRLSLQPGPWCLRADSTVDLAALAILADLGLAASIRANLSREARLGTVSMHLQFTGVPAKGRLVADGEFADFLRDGAGRLGMSRISVSGAQGRVCFGSGTFMALQPPKGVRLHPIPMRNRKSREPETISETGLSDQEKQILERADAALDQGGEFARNFWGPENGVLRNGPHAGNRVGHAQGGILIAMAAASAADALNVTWRLSSISAGYVAPGDGRVLRSSSRAIHLGSVTAVVRTQITNASRGRVLEVLTTWIKKNGLHQVIR